MSPADNFANSLDPDQAWQTIWHSDGIPEGIFQKVDIEKKWADDKKAYKINQN